MNGGQKKIGDVVNFDDYYDCTFLSVVDMKRLFSHATNVEKFLSFPFLSIYLIYSPLDCTDWFELYSPGLRYSPMETSITRPVKVAYFDSYEE